MLEIFEPWLSRWGLTADGAPIKTRSGRLLPVRQGGHAAMLKIASHPEERAAAPVMRYWDGVGAAPVLALEEEALLLERACGPRSLIDYAHRGRDDEATRVLCEVAKRLHAPRAGALPALVPLERWFRVLGPSAALRGGVFASSEAIARDLLAAPQDERVLHGDLHHENVLDFGKRGWLAIDPKGIRGERGFDLAVLFCNPDADAATDRATFARRLAIVSERANLDRARLLHWIVAYCGLSATWFLDDKLNADLDLAIAALALELV